jgi:hypothetical protein
VDLTAAVGESIEGRSLPGEGPCDHREGDLLPPPVGRGGRRCCRWEGGGLAAGHGEREAGLPPVMGSRAAAGVEGRGQSQDPQPSQGGREEGSPPVVGAVLATGCGAGGDAVATGHEETTVGCC